MGCSTSTDKNPPFPKLGVTMKAFQQFIDNCGGEQKLSNLTTDQVKDQYLIKKINNPKLSYCEYLVMKNDPGVGTPTVFISHAWAYKFIDVFNALKNYFKNNENVCIWFDLFSNNQSIAIDLAFDWWTGTFQQAIKNIGNTVMVLAPWQNPEPLRRAWCLFEVYCTHITDSEFHVALSNSEEKRFIESLISDFGAIDNMLAYIDVEKSNGRNPADKEKIFSIIEGQVGFENLNKMVLNRMHVWIIETAVKVMQSYAPENKPKLQLALGALYTKRGEFIEAEKYILQSLEMRRKLYGEANMQTLQSVNSLCLCYSKQGKLNEAKGMYEACLSACEIVHGPNSPETLKVLSNLSDLLGPEHINEVQSNLERIYGGFKSTLGLDDPATLVVMNKLGVTYYKNGLWNAAEDIYLKCYVQRQTKLGYDHPDTLITCMNLGSLYEAKEDFAQAEAYYKLALQRRQVKLGSSNPATLTSLHNMASLYLRKLDFTAAEPLLKECLKTRKAILGESHADTLLTMCKLGDLYAQRQQWNEAEHYYLLVLEYRKKDPGLQHLQTMDIISSLTTIYDSQKRYTDSEGYYILLLAFRENYFGKYHLETKNTRKKLANVKSNMGKNAEAEMLIKINTETYVDGDEVTPGQGITKMSSQRVVSARRSITQDMVKETEVVDFRNLGNIHLKQGKIQEAKLAYSKGLDLARVKLGPLHKYVFILTYELGQCLDKLGEQESAQSIYEISIKNSEVGTDQDIFDTNALVDESIYYISDIKISLSLYYNSQKRYQESKLLCAQAHAGFLSVKGKTHLNTLHAMINLADVHFNLNEIHKAEEIYVECAQDLKDTVGSEHPSTVTALTGIYSCVQKIPEKAEPILLELIDIKKKVSGYADVEVFTLLSNLGFVYVKLRQYDKAEEAYKECIDKSTETMGATYDVNIKARINLMKLYKMQNRQEEYLVLKASSPDSALSPS